MVELADEMPSKRLVCFSGLPGAGKSMAVEYASNELPVDTIVMGEIVKTCHREEHGGDGATETDVGEYATRRRQEDGDTWVAKETAARLQNDDEYESDVVFVDGVRSQEELDHFSQHFERVDLVYVFAPPEVRLERVRDRGQTGEEDASMEYIRERDDREGQWGVYQLIAYERYDYRINNVLEPKHLTGAVDAIYKHVANVGATPSAHLRSKPILEARNPHQD